jgi:hypothetical protein
MKNLRPDDADQASPADPILMKPSNSSCNGCSALIGGDARAPRGAAPTSNMVPKIAEKSPLRQLVPVFL